jgi:glycine cleavage system transcriptional repressor
VPHLAVTAVGADRPGIVAALTKVFVDLGCNIEDSTMTVLRGQFAMVLVVEAPPGTAAEALEEALAGPVASLDLVVSVRTVTELAQVGEAGDEAGRWTVLVYGTDHPGIVHGVASVLADHGVNIVDLSTRVLGEPGRPVYAMVLDVALPPKLDPDVLARRLRTTAVELGVDVSLHPSDADIL